MSKQIGWFILKEDYEFENTFECAAWYERVKVKAGRYPMAVPDYATRPTEDGRKVSGHIDMIGVNLPGIITSDEFGARFCGVPVGNYDNSKNRGKQSSHYFRSYLFEVAKAILEPENRWVKSWDYELLPEYEAREINFVYNNKPVTTWGIFEKGTKACD